MNPIFKDYHRFKSDVEKICEYFYDGIEWLERKLNLYHSWKF